ncbi:MAG TPA: flagellin, partial [Solirubrobacteraceae bacterium]|nr:flagellin [Solirubrobacteraceae bacterium]
NVNNAVGWTQSASTGLQTIQSTISSALTLTTEGANATMNANDLKDAAQQIYQYIQETKQAANTQYDGSYVFSGTATTTPPYAADSGPPPLPQNDTYAGNSGSISRVIGPGTTLAINANVSTVLNDNSSTGYVGLLSTLRNVYNDMTGQGGGTQADLGNQLTALQKNLGQLEQLQSQVGATQDRLTMAATRIQSLQTTTTTQLGTIEDTDMAQATLQYSTEQAGYQAALQSTASIIQDSLLKFLQ